MAITTIFGKDPGSVAGDTPSPALTLLYTESHEELPKSGSDGDMAYGMAGEEKGAVYKFKEDGLEWEKIEDGGSGLPEVTAEDDGDVLTVVEGAWAKAAPSGGSVLPPFKFYALVVTYDSTTETGEGRVYRCKDGQFERTHIISELSLEHDQETQETRVVVGSLEVEAGASAEDISDAAQEWLSALVYSSLSEFAPDDLNTILPVMLFLS